MKHWSKQQEYWLAPDEDFLSWPYPKPAVAAGPNQYQRARKLLLRQYEITRDKDWYCNIVSRKGKVVATVGFEDIQAKVQKMELLPLIEQTAEPLNKVL
jgi:hypothetical protein